MTLEQIIEREKANRVEDGMFGMEECKYQIKFFRDNCGQGLYQQLEEYVKRANTDRFFNKRMVLACWELINEQ